MYNYLIVFLDFRGLTEDLDDSTMPKEGDLNNERSIRQNDDFRWR